MSELSPEQYQQKVSKLTFTNPKVRIFTGFLLNPFDIILAPALMMTFGLAGPGTVGSKISLTLFCATIMGVQIFLATKGYTPSKFILGRKVIDVRTLEKASVFNVLARPVIAAAWMYCMIGVTFLSAALGGMFASLFHVKEYDRYDAAYNQALTTSMATASGGFVTKLLFKHPKLVWLHDTLLKTTVISVPYSQVIAEIKGQEVKHESHEQKAEIKKVA